MYQKRKKRIQPFDVFVYAVAAALLVIVAYPLILVISCSFSSPELVATGKITLLPREITFDGYREILKNNGFVVYLQVTAEQAVERVGDVSTRPLFKNLETARQTIAGRLPMYEDVASVSIDTVGKSINVVAQEIQEILEKEGVLCLRQE